MYLLVGSEPKLPGFNGKLAYFFLYLGPGAYRKGLTFDETFNFGNGAMDLYQLSKPLRVIDKSKERSVVYDAESVIVQFDLVHEDGKTMINGQGEYSFGLWTRWMRTAPKYLPVKESQHLIGRFTTLKNHKDNENLKDRTLISFVG